MYKNINFNIQEYLISKHKKLSKSKIQYLFFVYLKNTNAKLFGITYFSQKRSPNKLVIIYQLGKRKKC